MKLHSSPYHQKPVKRRSTDLRNAALSTAWYRKLCVRILSTTKASGVNEKGSRFTEASRKARENPANGRAHKAAQKDFSTHAPFKSARIKREMEQIFRLCCIRTEEILLYQINKKRMFVYSNRGTNPPQYSQLWLSFHTQTCMLHLSLFLSSNKVLCSVFLSPRFHDLSK